MMREERSHGTIVFDLVLRTTEEDSVFFIEHDDEVEYSTGVSQEVEQFAIGIADSHVPNAILALKDGDTEEAVRELNIIQELISDFSEIQVLRYLNRLNNYRR